MVLFKDHKVAFLFPPKTGSTTAFDFLKKSKHATILDGHHVQPQHALKLEPNLHEYTVYSFLRNPAERFISALLMLRDRYFIENFINALLRDDVTDCKNFVDIYYCQNKHKLPGVLFYSQAKYFCGGLNVNALDFDNYEAELRRVTRGFELDDIEIGLENESIHDGKKAMAKKVISFVKNEYAEDCALWQERLGKVLC